MADMETMKSELDRSFRVLGADRGFDQNMIDIKAWKTEGIITAEEAHDLRKYNREVYHELPVDW